MPVTQAAQQAGINAKVLDYVEKTGEALGVALKLADEADRVKVATAERVPGLIQKLKVAKLIDDDDLTVKEATQHLSNPVSALDVLSDVLTHYSKQASEGQKTAALSLGQGEPQQSAVTTNGHDKHAAYAGHRRGYSDEMPESDRVLLKFLN